MAQGTVDSVEASDDHLQRQVQNARRELPMMLEVISKNIVYRSGMDDLQKIVQCYPDSLLAQMATPKLHAIENLITKEAENRLDDTMFTEPPRNPEVSVVEDASAKMSDPELQESSQVAGDNQSDSLALPIAIICAFVGGMVCVGVILWRRRASLDADKNLEK